ncbi:MAG: ATP-binding protein [Verrucomicrobia bacterium]|nr:ATP-binding protein [Verrucomicrobiota bacterium]
MSTPNEPENTGETQSSSIDPVLLRRCVADAQHAVISLWDGERHTFWRSTEHRARESQTRRKMFFPTVTLRCLDALLSLAVEFPEWAASALHEQVLNDGIQALLAQDESRMQSTLNLDNAKDELNIFTLSLYIQTFSRICTFAAATDASRKLARDRIQSSVRDLINHSTFKAEKKTASENVHPFILYHICRALAFSASNMNAGPIKERANALRLRILTEARDSIERLLAKHRLGALNPSESVALAFCAASLALFAQREDRQHIVSSLNVCFESQDPGGCWALGRVIRQNKDIANNKLEIPTYEMAGVIAETVIELAVKTGERLSDAFGKAALQRSIQAGLYAERSIVRMSGSVAPHVGWCTDHAYGLPLIESWTSALALQSLLNLHKLIQESLRQRILATFTSLSPSDRDWPGWLRWSKFLTNNEIDHDHPVLSYLDAKVVQPILADPRGLPPLSPRSVSVLLFGPPGTSKTTIVKAVADGLGWPVILLSPGNFIERGLEFIEAQARSVFDHLLQLSKAVIIFDECDELFRDRAPIKTTEQMRGITAFVTASMLPKLQELHDRGRVLFFICTNNFDSMDPAVKRGGRVDHIVGVGPPDLEARRKIVESTVADLRRSKGWQEPKLFQQAMLELPAATERFTRSEIQRVVRTLAKRDGWANLGKAQAAARSVAEHFKASLTIVPEEFQKFLELNKTYSHAVTEGV